MHVALVSRNPLFLLGDFSCRLLILLYLLVFYVTVFYLAEQISAIFFSPIDFLNCFSDKNACFFTPFRRT